MIVGPLEVLEDADPSRVQEQIKELLAAGARALMILAGEQCVLDLPAWDALLQRQAVPVFGGVFPRVLLGARDFARGLLIVGFACPVEVCIVEGLNDERPAFIHQPAHFAGLQDAGTVMVWVDAMARSMDNLLESCYDALGAGPAYLGGGAGSLSWRPRPCLFSNRGVLQGAALLVGLEARVGLGVQHGLEAAAGPYLVSTVRNNEIRSLDFRPAFQVYAGEIEQLSGVRVSAENFHALARTFPLGLERMDGSFLVREPVRLDGDDLLCIGNVPAQSAIHVLHGRPESLARVIGSAFDQALARAAGVSAALLVDCVSRANFLEFEHTCQLQQLGEILAQAGYAEAPVFGVLSLGEIVNPGGCSLEFHNKAFVLGLMPDVRA